MPVKFAEISAMKLTHVQFTVRRMMVAVAVVAMGLGIRAQIVHWNTLARSYEIRAARLDRLVKSLWKPYAVLSHEQWLADCRAVDEVNRKGGRTWGPDRYGPEPAFARRMAEHLDMIAKKYHRLASQPWWPVEPDPTPPKP
jgi:hypothetical protein